MDIEQFISEHLDDYDEDQPDLNLSQIKFLVRKAWVQAEAECTMRHMRHTMGLLTDVSESISHLV